MSMTTILKHGTWILAVAPGPGTDVVNSYDGGYLI